MVTFCQDKHFLLELYGKILGVVFSLLAALTSWYKFVGWECLISFTMLVGILKSCGSFLWAKQCFANAHRKGDVSPVLCREEIALGAFELLYVVSLFVVLLITKHDVHPWSGDPKVAQRGRRAARPGRESFVRRGLQAIWKAICKEKDLLWWSCVTLWVSFIPPPSRSYRHKEDLL